MTPMRLYPVSTTLSTGIEINEAGDTVKTVGYNERIAIGKEAHEALRAYDKAMAAGDKAAGGS